MKGKLTESKDYVPFTWLKQPPSTISILSGSACVAGGISRASDFPRRPQDAPKRVSNSRTFTSFYIIWEKFLNDRQLYVSLNFFYPFVRLSQRCYTVFRFSYVDQNTN